MGEQVEETGRQLQTMIDLYDRHIELLSGREEAIRVLIEDYPTANGRPDCPRDLEGSTRAMAWW